MKLSISQREKTSKSPEVYAVVIDLVVTSPPYPMIEMWDEMFAVRSHQISLESKRSDACWIWASDARSLILPLEGSFFERGSSPSLRPCSGCSPVSVLSFSLFSPWVTQKVETSDEMFELITLI